jgi:hypothetical protein
LSPSQDRAGVISADRRLRALHALLRRVDDDDVPRVQEAIRRRQRLLEAEQADAEFPTAFDTSPSAADASPREPGARGATDG